MALSIINVVVTPPSVAGAADGRIRFDVTNNGPYGFNVYITDATNTTVYVGPATSPLSYDVPGFVAGTYYLNAYQPGGVQAEYVAMMYDPPAAAPPTVETLPAALVAAHLPVMVVLRAEPQYVNQVLTASVLLLVIEAKDGTGWREIGRERKGCDPVLGTVRFNLSEYLKTQFSETPPDESGAGDPALGYQYRARFGRVPAFTGAAGTEAGAFGGLAVNAALPVNPGANPLPIGLGPLMPYANVPATAARFQSIASATGVANVATVPVNSTAWPCPARQFVWLDPSGAWVWGLFTGRHEHGTDTGEDAQVRRAEGDYYVGGGDTRPTLQVYSDKLDWPTFQVLVGIRRARRVYERLASGQYVPVLIGRGAQHDYKETDKAFEVNFTAKYPVLTVQTF